MPTILSEFDNLYIAPELDDFGLDVPSFRLYTHITRLSREGVCTNPIDSLAETCRMNRKTAYKALKTLRSHRLIIIVKRAGRPHEIFLTDSSSWTKEPETFPLSVMPGWVYLIQAGETGRYKIGFTSNIKSRLAQLSAQSAFPLKLVAAYPSDDASGDESGWHKLFEAQRVHGEWFELSDAQIDSFQAKDSIRNKNL